MISACAECREKLGKGSVLRMEAERPLCLACADLDQLVFVMVSDLLWQMETEKTPGDSLTNSSVAA